MDKLYKPNNTRKVPPMYIAPFRVFKKNQINCNCSFKVVLNCLAYMGFLKYDCLYKVKYSTLCMSNNSNTDDYNQEEIVKKEARGLGDDTDFGEVQEILGEYIITKKGNVAKDIFHIPKNLVERFDGDTVYFKITKDEAKQYKRDY